MPPDKIKFDHNQARTYYAYGMTPTQIAKRFGVSLAVIRYVLKKPRTPEKKRAGPTRASVAEMLRMKDTGMGYAEIGRRLGVSRQAVYQVIHRHSAGLD